MKDIFAHRQKISEELNAFISKKGESISPGIMWGPDFTTRLKTFAASGKLLRGCMVCYVYTLFTGKTPPTSVIKAAAALELTHAALLMHDDVMDQDDLRRGKPSFHSQYKQKILKHHLSDPSRFSESAAICAGDASIFLALELFNDVRVSRKNSVYNLFAHELTLVCMGQIQDMYLQALPTNPSKSTIYATMQAKTASYSGALPLEIGSLLAGQPSKIQKDLRRLGIITGLIFQIRDDELSLTGNPTTTGKPVGSDIKDNKKTLARYYLFKYSEKKDTERLRLIFGNPKAKIADIKYVQKLYQNNRPATAINKEIENLQKKAFKQIDIIDVTSSGKDTFRSLVRFCSQRTN